MKPKPNLHVVPSPADPQNILTHLVMALCESYNLDLETTSEKLRGLIAELQQEVQEKQIEHSEFQAMAEFISAVMSSDIRTIEEFLRYAETTDV